MCNWYVCDLAEWEIRELVDHYKLIGYNWREPIEVFPNRPGAVVVDRGDVRALEHMLWGLAPCIEGSRPSNFLTPEFAPWNPLIENKAQRCVVPATRFAKPGRNTSRPAQWWFARSNHKPFMFAGVWTTWWGDGSTNEARSISEQRLYSIMITEANAVVRPVDDAMPVILTTAAEVEQWLTGSVEEALTLQKPPGNDVVKLVPDAKEAA